MIIYKNEKIITKKINKLPHKKFTPDYLSKSYTPYKGNKHTIQSITKSIVSLLFGIAIENKHIDISFLNENIYQYFDNYTLSKKIKIEHLLTMTSGIDWNTNYDDPNNTTFLMEHSKDWIQFIMEQKMKNIPGKQFHYKDCDTVLLGHIFEKITNISMDKYAKKYLFSPLKITAYWNKVNKRVDPEGGLYMSSNSLLKIGELILNKGKYMEKQIISLRYYNLMVKNHMPKNTKHFFGYGYQWWLYDNNVIFGWGYMGQYLVMIPEKGVIGILLQWNNMNEIKPYEFISILNE